MRLRLPKQCFDVLTVLLEHAGEVVTREELQRRLWRDDVVVDFERNLNTTIARLRETLRDSPDHPRYIETLPKRGYRFIAPISEALPKSGRAPAAKARLLVLPFANLSGDPSQEYLNDAVTNEMITALAGLAPEYLGVIARTTAMQY